MANRPILCLPNPRPVDRLRGSPSSPPRPKGPGRDQQVNRFSPQFNRLEAALKGADPRIELRRDPFGIAPERALVFVTKGPINNFMRAAKRINLEILMEFELGINYELPSDLISYDQLGVNPTLYASMPSLNTLREILHLWRRYEKGDNAEYGFTPWWNLFDTLAELRAWGPEDRLTAENCLELKNRLPLDDDDEEIRIELEYWPNKNESVPVQWRRKTELRIIEMDGRIIDRSSIHEGSFHYEALLVSLSARYVREMINEPSAPDSLATLDGLQFIVPQTIAQSLPSQSPSIDINSNNLEDFDDGGALRVLLFDGTPIAEHPVLKGGGLS